MGLLLQWCPSSLMERVYVREDRLEVVPRFMNLLKGIPVNQIPQWWELTYHRRQAPLVNQGHSFLDGLLRMFVLVNDEELSEIGDALYPVSEIPVVEEIPREVVVGERVHRAPLTTFLQPVTKEARDTVQRLRIKGWGLLDRREYLVPVR